MLSQTRADINPEVDNIADSLERSGELINQIDVACMTREALEGYIDFVNRIWGSNHHINDYPSADNGFYYLVIAGHTRTLAMIAVEAKRSQTAREHGYETNYLDAEVVCKVKYAPTPEDIIALQLEENIHHEVPRERQAMCIVETYLYGLETGKWDNPTDFARQANGRFSEKLVRNAMLFSRLPEYIRDHVFIGMFHYSSAIELAKAYPELLRYCQSKYFESRSLEDMSPEELEEIQTYAHEWLGRQVAWIQSKKLNTSAVRKMIKQSRQDWQDEIEEALGGTPQPALFMVDPKEEFREARRKLRYEYREALAKISEDPLKKMARAIAIHSQLILGDNPEESTSVVEQQARAFLAAVGKPAMQATVLARAS